MENLSKTLTTVDSQQGESISMVGDTYRMLVSGKQTGGAYAVIDMLIPPNGGPGPHAHASFQEAFYIIDGEIEVKTDDLTYTASKGTYVNIPLGGMVHCFKNKTTNLAHMLCIITPAGMEDMFMELGQPVKVGDFLPPPEMDDAMLAKFKAVAEKYGQKLFPPDYLV